MIMPFNMDVVCMPLTRYVCTRVVRSLMRWSGWDEVTVVMKHRTTKGMKKNIQGDLHMID